MCVEWGYCERRAAPQLADKVALCTTVADVLAASSIGVPPFSLSVLLVKLGLDRFCDCDGTERDRSVAEGLVERWILKASGKAPGHENYYHRHWYRAWFQLGQLYVENGRIPGGLAKMAKSFEMGGDAAASDDWLLNEYAWALIQTDHGTEALRIARKAQALEPNDDAVLDTLAMAHFAVGEYEEAIEWLEQSIEVGVANDANWKRSEGGHENLYHLVRACLATSDLQRARDALAQMESMTQWTSKARSLIESYSGPVDPTK